MRSIRQVWGLAPIALLGVIISCSHGEQTKQSPVMPPLPPLKVNPFAGLDPLGADTAQAFTFRVGPKPPPMTTRTEKLRFPVAQAAALQPKVKQAQPGLLRVLRTQPKGTDKLIGAVTVDFSQPMVRVTSLAELRRQTVPLTITPQVKGRFRWLGTQTLAFEPEGRMPYGTHYVAVVPAGTRSALGAVLEREVRFEFTTPRPALVQAVPWRWTSQARPDTAIGLLFNQRVRIEQLLQLLAMNGLRGKDLEVVPRASWEKLPDVGHTVVTWDPERTVVLRPRQGLSRGTAYHLTIAAGLEGEGPLKSTNGINHVFTTYHPLRVEEIRCGDYQRCNPAHGFMVRFNNPLATTEWDKLIEVTPAPGGMNLESSGSWVHVRGEVEAQTRYTIRVRKGPVDIHKQTFSGEAEKTLRTGNISPDLRFPVQGLAALERQGKRQIPLEVQNVAATRLRLVQVDPTQILEVIDKARQSWDDGGKRDPLKGIKGLKVTRTLQTGIKPNGKGKIGIATDEALGQGGAGPVYVELRSDELRKENRWANPFRGIVVQVTDLGIMARYDNDQIVALITRLEAGTPLPGAAAELRDRQGKVIWSGKADGKGLVRAPGRRALAERQVIAYAPFVLWARAGADRAFVVLGPSGDDGSTLQTYANWAAPIPPRKQLAMHLFSDRSPYRPGETVHLKGVLRVEATLPSGGVEALTEEREVSYTVTSSRGHKIVEGKGKLGASGAFAVDVVIPEQSDLGTYRVEVKPTRGPFSSTPAYGSFQVEEYRAPEFAVKVEVRGEPYFLGDRLRAEVGADYLFGAPMSSAQCAWTLTRAAGAFVPPGNDGFSFGDPIPWSFGWQLRRGARRHREGLRTGTSLVQQTGSGDVIDSGTTTLDATGRVKVSTKLDSDPESKRVGPGSFTLEAQVTDQNRQSIANRKVIVVHPAARYVGLHADKTVVKEGEPIKVQAVLVDLEGKRVAGQSLTVEAVQVKTKISTVFEDGRWAYKFADTEQVVGSCAVTTAAEPRDCSLTLPKAGGYKLRTAAADDRGRKTRTSVQVYAYGPGYVPWNLQNQSQLELVPDKQEYHPGDVARVLVKSPLAQSIGLLTVQRGGLDHVEVLSVKGTAQVVEIPIKPYHLPEVFVAVSLARGRVSAQALGKAAQDLGRPTFAHGALRLPVTLDEKRVEVTVKPAKAAVGPSEKVKIRLRTTDRAGKPIRGELAVMIVDEGVLSLLSYATPDPLAFFHHARVAGAPLADLRNALLGKPEGLKREKRRKVYKARREPSEAKPDDVSKLGVLGAIGTIGHGGGGGSGAGYGRGAAAGPAQAPLARSRRAAGADEEKRSTDRPDTAMDSLSKSGEAGPGAARIRSRSVFATTAYYNPAVVTDEKGWATITVSMPDDLTTYRVMAVALDPAQADRFGSGEAQLKVRKPLLLRPSLPRFLSVGDSFEAAVMVHNETDSPGMVDVLVRGRKLKPQGPTRVQVKIDAHRAKEVRFKLLQDGPGPARVQFAAVLGPHTDAVEKQLPVLLPVTTEAFATYGMTDASVTQPVVPPKDALPEYGGLEVSMASTALNGLEDAVSYLVDYPHECTEQTASRVLPIYSLGAILRDFQIAKLKDLKESERLAQAGVRKLIAYQRYDGGWGNWQGSTISWPYLSAYATYALLRAKEAKQDVPQHNLDRARAFLKHRLDYPLRQFGEQWDYVGQTASVWILSELKQHERAHLGRLYGLRKRYLPMYAQALLMVALHRAEGRSARVQEILRDLNNAAVQTAAAAHFSEIKTESLRLLMHSDDFTDAVVLGALLEVDPQHALMPKVARGLMDSRVRGRWSTTHANSFALTALARYYKQVENVVPDYLSQIWYGEGYMGEGTFKGRQMKVVQQQIPMDALRKLGERQLVLAKQGEGKLYYRIGLRYAPTDLKLPPEEQGFSISRIYEPIADPRTGKVQRSVTQREDGTWQITAGATVRVRLVVVVPDRRYFVAIADPLPAGLEAVNLGLATSAQSLSGQLDNRTYDTTSWYSLFAFDHREMRDDRVVLFADQLPAGVYEYTYLARATSYGRFVVAPVKAEEMYHPETFGRSATTFVEVK